jgi:hypothetical protein
MEQTRVGMTPSLKAIVAGGGEWEGTALDGTVGGAAFDGTYGGGRDRLVRPDEEREGRRAPLLIATQAAAARMGQGGQTLRGAAEKEREVVGGVGSGIEKNLGMAAGSREF